MEACTYEDGSAAGQPFPCMWDASTSGNGQGASFVLDFAGGVPHYVTQVGPDGTIYTADVVSEVGTADTLAATGMDPIGALTASGLVIIGALLLVIRRLTH